MDRRAAVRRQRRDLAAVPDETIASDRDPIDRARALERLSAALVALDEPFRTTVIRRYLDDESAADIARSLGHPRGHRAVAAWRRPGSTRLRAAPALTTGTCAPTSARRGCARSRFDLPAPSLAEAQRSRRTCTRADVRQRSRRHHRHHRRARAARGHARLLEVRPRRRSRRRAAEISRDDAAGEPDPDARPRARAQAPQGEGRAAAHRSVESAAGAGQRATFATDLPSPAVRCAAASSTGRRVRASRTPS